MESTKIQSADLDESLVKSIGSGGNIGKMKVITPAFTDGNIVTNQTLLSVEGSGKLMFTVWETQLTSEASSKIVVKIDGQIIVNLKPVVDTTSTYLCGGIVKFDKTDDNTYFKYPCGAYYVELYLMNDSNTYFILDFGDEQILEGDTIGSRWAMYTIGDYIRFEESLEITVDGLLNPAFGIGYALDE